MFFMENISKSFNGSQLLTDSWVLHIGLNIFETLIIDIKCGILLNIFTKINIKNPGNPGAILKCGLRNTQEILS